MRYVELFWSPLIHYHISILSTLLFHLYHQQLQYSVTAVEPHYCRKPAARFSETVSTCWDSGKKIRGRREEKVGRLLHFQLPGTRLRRRIGKISSTTWRLHFRYLSPISAHECASTENNEIECSNEMWGMNKRLCVAFLASLRVVYKVLNFAVDPTMTIKRVKVL